ncbi:hypothetical protein EV175_005041 [Coemansia sp. RSA 1933]|nr:hypothetical protein EV175_005041 [Coemansia sp. RSA 1933]
MAMCGPLSTENLLFSHFIRVEIVVPSWMSSERFVYTDIPVQLLTYGLNNVARILHRRASTSSIDRRGTESDASSVVSGTSSHRASRQMSRDSAEVHGMTLTPEGKAVVMSALPPRYCDVPLDQRTSPALINVNQAVTTPGTESGRESSAKQRQSRASRTSHVSHISHTSHVSQSTTAQRHPTISSAHGSDRRMTMSTTNIADYAGEEKYRTRQLPAPPPPPLPVAPMPTSAFVQTGSIPSPGAAQSSGMNGCHSRNTSISSQPNSPSQKRHDESALTTSAMSPVDNLRNSDVTFVQQGFKHMSLSASIRSTGSVYRSDTLSGGTAGQPRTPLSPVYNDNISPDAGSDDDAGYFKSSAMKNAAESERPFEKGSLFRLRKNSSIKQLRKEPDFQMQYPLP